MKKLAIAAAVALTAAGCAHNIPQQVNRTAKASKYSAPVKSAPVEMPTPNQAVKKRWFGGYKIKLFH